MTLSSLKLKYVLQIEIKLKKVKKIKYLLIKHFLTLQELQFIFLFKI